MRAILWTFPILLGLLTAAPAEAFRNVKTESYVDPDYAGYRFYTVAVLAENTSFETAKKLQQQLTRRLGKHGVVVVDHKRILPPTRDWTNEDRARAYKNNHIDAVLIVTAGASASAVIPIATQTFTSGSATAYGYSGTFSGNSTSYSVATAKSKAEFSAVLMDVEQSRVAWYCDLLVKAGGLLYVSDKGDGKGAANGVLKALLDDGLLSR